jgi:hypothetical protein
MRPDTDHIERFRTDGKQFGNECFNGAWIIPHPPTNVSLKVISSDGPDWDHVSVSLRNRTPNWREMDFICRLFWSEDEAVMQLHPPRSEWVSYHPFCLHMWKPQGIMIPLPPTIMVGPKGIENDPRTPEGIRAHNALVARMLAQLS